MQIGVQIGLGHRSIVGVGAFPSRAVRLGDFPECGLTGLNSDGCMTMISQAPSRVDKNGFRSDGRQGRHGLAPALL